ncbi:MAG: hypothetical protein DRH50_03630 [Deltaproteobacteria bacterium]|nr:MAG: hypothetical protein DRH50_03630 [Deltaproteobacteria bacterium]
MKTEDMVLAESQLKFARVRVCFLSSMHPPLDKRVFEKEAVSLAERGYEVILIAPDRTEKSWVERGCKIVTYKKGGGSLRYRAMRLWLLFKKALRIKADVYHANEVDSWILAVLLKIFRFGRSKVIFDVHEHYVSIIARRFPSFIRPFVEKLVKLLFRMLTPLTDHLIFAKSTIVCDYSVNGKYTVVYNFSFSKVAESLAASLETNHRNKREGEFVAIYTGLINKMRCWPEILEAASLAKERIKDLRLVFIGEFNDGTEEEFRRKIDELGLEGCVNYMKWMPLNELYIHLLTADVGLVTLRSGEMNHIYAMPHKMFDYMAAGLPVIIPNFSVEIVPMLEDCKCGVAVKTDDSQKLAEALIYFYENPDERRRMGERGRKAVIKSFNWEGEREKLFRVYEELIEKPLVRG